MITVFAGAAWPIEPMVGGSPPMLRVDLGVIGIVAYSTGWGPILSLGFIFGAASASTSWDPG